VVNASISGETTSGGRARLPALLAQHHPSVVVIELGGNDALRGLALQHTEENLVAMVQAAQQAGAKVLLVGMQVPPNYGAAYTQRFAALFPKVARAHKAALVPFCSQVWPTGPTPRPRSSPTASTRTCKRSHACWPTSGRSSSSCCADQAPVPAGAGATAAR